MKTKEVRGRMKFRDGMYYSPDELIFSRCREDKITTLSNFIKKTFGDKVVLEITMKVVRYVKD